MVFFLMNTKLKTASNYTKAFDLLLDAYQDIGNNLPQFGKYAQLFGDKPSARKVLIEVFGGILRFHKRAMGFFRRSGLSIPSFVWFTWLLRITVRSGLLWGFETDVNVWISLETTI